MKEKEDSEKRRVEFHKDLKIQDELIENFAKANEQIHTLTNELKHQTTLGISLKSTLQTVSTDLKETSTELERNKSILETSQQNEMYY